MPDGLERVACGFALTMDGLYSGSQPNATLVEQVGEPGKVASCIPAVSRTTPCSGACRP